MNKLIDKKVGVYLKKENEMEEFLTGVSRLSWLTYEFQNESIFTKLYVDKHLHTDKLNKLLEDIKYKKIEAVLIWSSNDIMENDLQALVIKCFIAKIPIISFCEGEIGINETMKIENQRFMKKYKHNDYDILSEYFIKNHLALK